MKQIVKKAANAAKSAAFRAATAATLAVVTIDSAFAVGKQQNAGNVAANLANQFGDFATLAANACYLLSGIFFIAAVFKFKAHNDDPRQTPLKPGFVLLLLAGLAAAPGAVITMSTSTTMGTGTTQVISTGGGQF